MDTSTLPLGREQARLWTKPLRPLTPTTSFGFEAIEFAEKILGRILHPWQKWFLIHSLELAYGSHTWDEYPKLRFKTVILLVARQNGKSFLLSTRMLWRMIMWDGPEDEPPLVLGAAHKISAAKEILELSIKALKNSDGHKYYYKSPMGAGNEHLEVTTGARWRIEAGSNDDGGRGLTVTDLGFDELRQQVDWEPWSALTNTTNARYSSQVLAVSNAGTAKSIVLQSLREQALARIEEFDNFEGSVEQYVAHNDVSLGLFEWSAPDGAEVTDVDALAQANPSVGYANDKGEVLLSWETLLSLASMVGKPGRGGISESSFRTEVMCQWVVASKSGPFTQEQIAQCIDDGSFIDEDSDVVVAIDVELDRSKSVLAVAGWRPDGLPHVEVITERAGTEWVPDTLANRLQFEPAAVVAQGRGAPVSSLIEYIEGAGVEVTPCQGGDSQAAATRFFDRVVKGTVRFRDDSSLMIALAEAQQKTFNDSWEWSRKASPVGIATLIAASEALWGLEQLAMKPDTPVTAYDESFGWYNLIEGSGGEVNFGGSSNDWWL